MRRSRRRLKRCADWRSGGSFLPLVCSAGRRANISPSAMRGGRSWASLELLMRVVLVNWAKIWDGASNGGGVNGYCLALALALRDRGHEVISLFGGVTYVPAP